MPILLTAGCLALFLEPYFALIILVQYVVIYIILLCFKEITQPKNNWHHVVDSH